MESGGEVTALITLQITQSLGISCYIVYILLITNINTVKPVSCHIRGTVYIMWYYTELTLRGVALLKWMSIFNYLYCTSLLLYCRKHKRPARFSLHICCIYQKVSCSLTILSRFFDSFNTVDTSMPNISAMSLHLTFASNNFIDLHFFPKSKSTSFHLQIILAVADLLYTWYKVLTLTVIRHAEASQARISLKSKKAGHMTWSHSLPPSLHAATCIQCLQLCASPPRSLH